MFRCHFLNILEGNGEVGLDDRVFLSCRSSLLFFDEQDTESIRIGIGDEKKGKLTDTGRQKYHSSELPRFAKPDHDLLAPLP